jgi:hypothetical protein
VVSPYLEDGVYHTGAALLALATVFYETLRARGGDFYDYPQHFALFPVDEEGMRTRQGRRPFDAALVRGPWGHLDVWPDTNWLTAGGTATALIHKVYGLHIQRLFWPEALRASGDETALPAGMQRLLQSRLKAVYLYDTADPNVEIGASPTAEQILRECIERLPRSAEAREGEVPPLASVRPESSPFPYVERHRRVTASDFLAAVCGERPQGERK